MKPIPLSEICHVLDINPQECDPSIIILHVSKDCKKLGNNTLIFHLNKEEEIDLDRFNNQTNCYIITDQPFLKKQTLKKNSYFYVLDVFSSFRKFMDYYRNMFNIPVVAVTGTCGKTTVKEMIRQVLEKEHKVVATKKSRNGIRHNADYVLNIDCLTEYCVFETAVSEPGDLIQGCSYFKPNIGVITNIGINHLAGCKTFDNYVRTKGELLAGLNNRGILIINGDDYNIRNIDFSSFKGIVLTFGLHGENDFFATHITYGDEGMHFTLNYDTKEYNAYVPGLGEHNVYNALASLAVLHSLGKDIRWSISNLATVNHYRSRLQFHKGFNHCTVIDDNGNSNHTSIKSAFEVLKVKGKGKIKIAVLGRIPDVGDYEEVISEQIGKMINEYGIDILFTIDNISKNIAKHAKAYGMDPHKIYHSENKQHIIEILKNLLNCNSVVIFKAPISDMNSVIQEIIVE